MYQLKLPALSYNYPRAEFWRRHGAAKRHLRKHKTQLITRSQRLFGDNRGHFSWKGLCPGGIIGQHTAGFDKSL